jgi:hypothetical protein
MFPFQANYIIRLNLRQNKQRKSTDMMRRRKNERQGILENEKIRKRGPFFPLMNLTLEELLLSLKTLVSASAISISSFLEPD